MSRPASTALAALAALALLAGCGSKPRPAPAPVQAAAAPTATAPEQAPDEKQAPVWSYSAVGKRDPFRSFLATNDGANKGIRQTCNTPLGKYQLDQLKLVAVITGLEDPVAMVETPAGVGYSVRRGACLGMNGGTVSAVRTGEVVVAEWAIRADGTRDRTQTVLSLPRPEALNLEEQP